MHFIYTLKWLYNKQHLRSQADYLTVCFDSITLLHRFPCRLCTNTKNKLSIINPSIVGKTRNFSFGSQADL